MHAIIVDGTDDFIKEAMQNLNHRGFSSIGYQAAYTPKQESLISIVRDLKDLDSYKKDKNKRTNKIYTCMNVTETK